MRKRKRNGGSHVRDVNGINRSTVSGGVVGCGFRSDDYPDSVVIASTPRLPSARESFTDAELAARIKRYASRASRGLPLFGKGARERRSAGNRNYPQCWACGAFAETSLPESVAGWSTRDCRVGATNAVECYCVTCMDRWGWPSECPLWSDDMGR